MATVTDAVRRPLDGTAIGLMVVLCMCWGFQQVAIKVADRARDMTSKFPSIVVQNT